MERERLKNARRIVVKVGTSTLTYDNGKVNYKRIEDLSRVLSDLHNQGREVILVSSGAIGVGINKMKLDKRPETIEEKQAVAAVGQCELMHIYSRAFADFDHLVGQILLTRDILENETGYINVRNTFFTLLRRGIIPIVNENDSVSVEEIRFGDNDTLSAIVSILVEADLLVILTDIDGYYDKDPRLYKDAHLIDKVTCIDEDVMSSAGGAGTSRGTGGMITKLQAAELANSRGIDTVIANGGDPEILYKILDGCNVGTLFVANKQ